MLDFFHQPWPPLAMTSPIRALTMAEISSKVFPLARSTWQHEKPIDSSIWKGWRMTDDLLFLLIIDNMLIQVIKMAWYIWLMELILWVQVISWFLGNNTTNYTLSMVHKCSCSWFIIIQNLGPSSVNGVNDSSLSIPFIPYMSCWWNISEHGGDLPRFKECPTSGGLDTGPLSGRAASLLRHNGCKVHREGISSHQFVLYALCTCK